MEEYRKREGGPERFLGRLVRHKKKIASVLTALFLYFPGFNGEAAARELNKNPREIELLLSGKKLPQTLAEGRLIESKSYELTKKVNDIEKIREFIKPGLPCTFNEFYGITIDVPSRSDFGFLVKFLTREICNNLGSFVPYFEKFPDRGGYKLSIKVEVRKFEEADLLIDFLLGEVLEEARRRGRIIEWSLLERLRGTLKATFAVATIDIEILDKNNEILKIKGFGLASIKGILSGLIDKDLIFREAIKDGFSNIKNLLKEVLEHKVKKQAESQVIFIVSES